MVIVAFSDGGFGAQTKSAVRYRTQQKAEGCAVQNCIEEKASKIRLIGIVADLLHYMKDVTERYFLHLLDHCLDTTCFPRFVL